MLIAEVREAERHNVGQIELPFVRLLYGVDGRAPRPCRTEILARELVDLLRAQISQVDFWRQPQAQQALRTQIVRWLDQPGRGRV